MKRFIAAMFAVILSVGCFAQVQHNEPDGFSWIEFKTDGADNVTGVQTVNGQIIIPAQFCSVEYKFGYFKTSQLLDKTNWTFNYALYDRNGHQILPPGIYGFRFEAEDGYIWVAKQEGVDYKFGAIEFYTGNFILPLVYRNVEYDKENKFFEVLDNNGFHNISWSKKEVSNQSNSDEVAELRRQVEELKRQVNGQQNSGGNVSTQSGGELQPHQEFRPCSSCGGTRKCRPCVGDGVYTIWAGGKSSSTRCATCGGSGVCNFCHGTGGTYETVYY